MQTPLYELLVGKLPFKNISHSETYKHFLQGERGIYGGLLHDGSQT